MANLKALFPRVADKFDTAMQELEHEAEQRKKEQEESNRARVEQERQAAEQKQKRQQQQQLSQSATKELQATRQERTVARLEHPNRWPVIAGNQHGQVVEQQQTGGGSQKQQQGQGQQSMNMGGHHFEEVQQQTGGDSQKQQQGQGQQSMEKDGRQGPDGRLFFEQLWVQAARACSLPSGWGTDKIILGGKKTLGVSLFEFTLAYYQSGGNIGATACALSTNCGDLSCLHRQYFLDGQEFANLSKLLSCGIEKMDMNNVVPQFKKVIKSDDGGVHKVWQHLSVLLSKVPLSESAPSQIHLQRAHAGAAQLREARKGEARKGIKDAVEKVESLGGRVITMVSFPNAGALSNHRSSVSPLSKARCCSSDQISSRDVAN